MENKAHALAAGAFVLAVTAMLIGLAMWLMRDVTNTTTYEMATSDAVTGLQVQAPVRYKGVAVGKVTAIGFDPDSRGDVLVTIAVSPGAPISRSTFATLGFQGVTGLSFVQLDDDGVSAEPPLPGPQGGPPRIPLKPGALGQLQDMVGSLADKIGHATDRLNEVLGPDNQAALTAALTEIGGAAKGVAQLAQTADTTLRTQLDPARADLPGLIQQTHASMQAVLGAAEQTRQTAAKLGDVVSDVQTALTRVTGADGVVDRLSDSADTVISTTLPRIQNLTEDASRTIRRLDRIANALSENPQALLYGAGAVPPGPGEPGFEPPAVAPTAP
ncbi:MAG: MlaD family protein [Pseudomonadota bacterium]|nr:MlaD family protein [Pseudomonadota bacterium]